MTDTTVISGTEALSPAFGWLGIQVGRNPGGGWNWERLADHDGHGGLHMRPGDIQGAVRSLVTVEVATIAITRRLDATVVYQGTITIPGTADTDGEVLWLGGDGAPVASSWPDCLAPGDHEVTIQVVGREESAAMADAWLEGPEDAEDPEPVEHWWVTFREITRHPVMVPGGPGRPLSEAAKARVKAASAKNGAITPIPTPDLPKSKLTTKEEAL